MPETPAEIRIDVNVEDAKRKILQALDDAVVAFGHQVPELAAEWMPGSYLTMDMLEEQISRLRSPKFIAIVAPDDLEKVEQYRDDMRRIANIVDVRSSGFVKSGQMFVILDIDEIRAEPITVFDATRTRP